MTPKEIQQIKSQIRQMRSDIRKISENIAMRDLTSEDREKYLDLSFKVEHLEDILKHYAGIAQKLKGKCQISPRFRSRTFDNFNANYCNKAYEQVYSYAKVFSENDGTGLLLLGNPGSGKTHLAAATMLYVMDNYLIPARFVNYNDFLENVKTDFDNRRITDLMDIPLLVLDDLGKEKPSNWSNAVLYRIINHRYENMLPVILTSNLSVLELQEYCGEAIFSRISEMCKCVNVVAMDYRKKKLKNIKAKNSAYDGR